MQNIRRKVADLSHKTTYFKSGRYNFIKQYAILKPGRCYFNVKFHILTKKVVNLSRNRV